MSNYRNLAKGTANIILDYSWEVNCVQDVLLYGSVLTNSDPNDIDLLVLHNSYMLENYTTSRSKLADGQSIRYHPSSVLLHQLGYRKGTSKEEGVFSKVCELFSEAGVFQWDGNLHPEGLNEKLDLHLLSMILFVDPEELGEKLHVWNWLVPKLREKAIKLSGKDPFYYNRILSTGRLYDAAKKDFVVPFEMKYPGKLRLFPSPIL